LPAADKYYPLPGAGVRGVLTDDTCASEFADLVEWRDQVYAKHWVDRRT
jgi:hypothetical protein